ncbi:MAG: MotA/TolQ/ExbB proton channel family protein [Phycisphaerales bacterium JB040]
MLDALLDIFRAGGWVMYPLLAMSLASVTLIIERAAFWARTHSVATRRFLAEASELLATGRAAQARTLAGKHDGLYARFLAGLLAGTPSDGDAMQRIETLRPAIERFGTTMATIVAAAPLLGILGTVTGIIQSFNLIGADDPVTDPTAVAAGIAQALYTTAYGLVVALVTVFPHAIYRTHAERCLARLEALSAAATESRDQA